MATFARKPIVNLASGLHMASVASVGTPRTSASGNMTCGVMFKTGEGACAFQYCNLNEDGVLIIPGDTDADEPQVVLPDNTQIFIDKMARAGVANPKFDEDLAGKLLKAKSIEDDDLRKQAVTRMLYEALRGFIGCSPVEILVDQAQFTNGSRSTLVDITALDEETPSFDEDSIDSL